MSGNSLLINMNPNWVPPFKFQNLYASSCILGPWFPKRIKYQRKLDVLQIPDTGIMDLFPEWFLDISPSLSYLNVSDNKLSGVLPNHCQVKNRWIQFGILVSTICLVHCLLFLKNYMVYFSQIICSQGLYLPFEQWPQSV